MAFAFVFTLATPLTSFAAYTAVVEAPQAWDMNQVTISTHYMENGSEIEFKNVLVNVDNLANSEAYMTRLAQAVISYGALQGYTLTGADLIFPAATYDDIRSFIATATSSLAAVATSGSFTDLDITPATHIADGATNADTGVSAASVAILGINVPTNASYTALVAAHNDLATKYNDAITKLNALLSALETHGLLSSS